MGGSVRQWSTDLEEGLLAGSAVELRVVLTNFSNETATIGYEVVVAAA